jgi:hypothetical protein
MASGHEMKVDELEERIEELERERDAAVARNAVLVEALQRWSEPTERVHNREQLVIDTDALLADTTRRQDSSRSRRPSWLNLVVALTRSASETHDPERELLAKARAWDRMRSCIREHGESEMDAILEEEQANG